MSVVPAVPATAGRRPDGPAPVAVRPDGPHWLVIAVPVALLTVAVCLVGVDRQLWIDEYVTHYVTTLTWSEFVRLLGNQDLVHALYYVLVRAWVELFGSSPIAMRLPSVVAMGVAAGGVTLLGRRLHSTAAGLAAGLFFAAIPAISRYGQEARSYGLVLALVVLSTVALTSVLARPTWWRWLGYGGLTLALAYLHFAAALILLPHLIMVFQALAAGGGRRVGRWFVVALAVTVLVDPLLYVASKQADQVSWVRADWPAVLVYPGDLFASQIVAGSLVLLGAVGAVVLATTRQRGAPTTSPGRALSPLLAWALCPPVLSYLTVDVTHLFLARYALYTLPAWCLLAAVAIVHAATPQGAPGAVRAWLSRGQAVGVVVVVVVVGLAGLTAQLNVRRSPLNGEPDFRAAAAIVDAGFQPRDGIVYVGVDRSARLPFGYELRRATPREVFVWRPPQVNGTFVPEPCADPVVCLDGVSRVWVVATNYADDIYRGLPEDQATALRGGFDVTQTRRAADAQVALLVRKPRR